MPTNVGMGALRRPLRNGASLHYVFAVLCLLASGTWAELEVENVYVALTKGCSVQVHENATSILETLNKATTVGCESASAVYYLGHLFAIRPDGTQLSIVTHPVLSNVNKPAKDLSGELANNTLDYKEVLGDCIFGVNGTHFSFIDANVIYTLVSCDPNGNQTAAFMRTSISAVFKVINTSPGLPLVHLSKVQSSFLFNESIGLGYVPPIPRDQAEYWTYGDGLVFTYNTSTEFPGGGASQTGVYLHAINYTYTEGDEGVKLDVKIPTDANETLQGVVEPWQLMKFFSIGGEEARVVVQYKRQGKVRYSLQKMAMGTSFQYSDGYGEGSTTEELELEEEVVLETLNEKAAAFVGYVDLTYEEEEIIAFKVTVKPEMSAYELDKENEEEVRKHCPQRPADPNCAALQGQVDAATIVMIVFAVLEGLLCIAVILLFLYCLKRHTKKPRNKRIHGVRPDQNKFAKKESKKEGSKKESSKQAQPSATSANNNNNVSAANPTAQGEPTA